MPVTVLVDQRPFVRILEPKANSFATPDAVLSVQIVAEDDFGLSRVQLFHSLNASRARAEDVPVPESQPTRLPVSIPLKLCQPMMNSTNFPFSQFIGMFPFCHWSGAVMEWTITPSAHAVSVCWG